VVHFDENSLATAFMLPLLFPVYSPRNRPGRAKRLSPAPNVPRTTPCHPQARPLPTQVRASACSKMRWSILPISILDGVASVLSGALAESSASSGGRAPGLCISIASLGRGYPGKNCPTILSYAMAAHATFAPEHIEGRGGGWLLRQVVAGRQLAHMWEGTHGARGGS
jgi:hypothetical protein